MLRSSGSAPAPCDEPSTPAGPAADVRRWLEHHATTAVPQPLAYLIDDIARQHGSIRVGPANAYVRIDDEAQAAALLTHPDASVLGPARARARDPGRHRRAVRDRGLPAPDRPQPRGRGLLRSVLDGSRPPACHPARRAPAPTGPAGGRGGCGGPRRRTKPARIAGAGRRRRTWSRRPGERQRRPRRWIDWPLPSDLGRRSGSTTSPSTAGPPSASSAPYALLQAWFSAPTPTARSRSRSRCPACPSSTRRPPPRH